MELRLIFVGKTDRGPIQELLADYTDRIGRERQVRTVIVPESPSTEPARRKREEAERLLKALEGIDRVVLLDERGVTPTSVEFAKRLGAWRDQGVRNVAFIIGGAYGVDDAVRKRADLVLALSAMTFPHQLVRVVLLEQLYRALSILAGRPYHH